MKVDCLSTAGRSSGRGVRWLVVGAGLVLAPCLFGADADERVELPATNHLGGCRTVRLSHADAPVNNPLKGFIPYTCDEKETRFPHSMEYDSFALRDLMVGRTNFQWQALDKKIAEAAAAGNHYGFRVYMDYPGRGTGIPQFLLADGLKTYSYPDFGNQSSVIPDYENSELRAALTNFIAALGRRYDGDARIGYIEAGLLGFWGEWHCSSGTNSQHFASPTVRTEVMEAYQAAFHKTKVLLRYPAAENGGRPFGYHDDSFCWDTLGSEAWTFVGRMQEGGRGVLERWRTEPIGGEMRPELWFCLWDADSCAPKGQEFNRCVEATHVSWLENTGVFERRLADDALRRALAGARKLGYEFQVSSVATEPAGKSLSVAVTITNMGVAPFYYDWPVELAAATTHGRLLKTWRTPWQITGILPGEPAKEQSWQLSDLPDDPFVLLLRVVNPLPNGKPLRFANVTQDETLAGWLTLTTIPIQKHGDQD